MSTDLPSVEVNGGCSIAMFGFWHNCCTSCLWYQGVPGSGPIRKSKNVPTQRWLRKIDSQTIWIYTMFMHVSSKVCRVCVFYMHCTIAICPSGDAMVKKHHRCNLQFILQQHEWQPWSNKPWLIHSGVPLDRMIQGGAPVR